MQKTKRRFLKKSKTESSETPENKTLQVKIEKIVSGGWGLGFAENLTVFTALACAGDEVLVRVRERKGKVVFCEIVEILQPSKDRIEPPCKYFGVCGGCDFQQLKYAAQLEAKRAIILDCFKRIGKINYEKEIEIIASPQEFGYRTRAQFHADSRNKKLGYFKRNSNQIVDVEECPILFEDLQKTLTDLRANLSWEEFWSELVEIETAASGRDVSIYSNEMIEPTREITFRANDENYTYNARSFFQGNAFLIEKLIEIAIADAEGETAVDLFSGVGLFTLSLARKFAKVYAVEGSQTAVEFATRNVANARLQNVEISNENTIDWLADTNLRSADFVLLDPPRIGADRETIEKIINLNPQEISYVSCDPATLARDLRIFLDAGHRINSVTALDLFPQTHHIETVVRLAKNID